MITKINNIKLSVLTLFTKGYNKDYYIREVQKLLGISSRTALLSLAELEKNRVLKSRIRGKIKTYTLDISITAKEYMIFAEQFKRIEFMEANPLIREIIEKIDIHIEGIAMIFGSYAKGIHKKSSDLDIFISGKLDETAIKEIGNRYGIRIDIKSYPIDILEDELHNDILLKEILNDHILIKGTETFVNKCMPTNHSRISI